MIPLKITLFSQKIDKRETAQTCDCIYEIPCKNCNKTYVGETRSAFETRLKEHMKDAEKVTTGGTRGLVERTRLRKCISQLSQTTLLNIIMS